MRVLFVHPSCRMSIWDVARGYRAALGNVLGEDSVKDYYLDRHLAYHLRALPDEVARDRAVLSRMASEAVLNEAIYFNADVVLIMSGLNFHPLPLTALEKVGIPAAVYLTECPYDDEVQREWAANYPSMAIFTHERYSAEQYGWTYLPHAVDPAVHYPAEPGPDRPDVLFVGTGWRERQQFLEAVDWTGINLSIRGPLDAWPGLTERSPLWPFFHNEVVDNAGIAPIYTGAKICVNFHRRHPQAWSPNPRAYEIAACGAFQLSDPRPGVVAQFGETVPVFETPEQLGALVRHYLAHEDERTTLAAASRRRVVPDETFDRRVEQLVAVLAERFQLPWLDRRLVSVA